MNWFGKTTALRVLLFVVLSVILRFGVMGLDNIDCRSYFSQLLFICDMGFFVLPILILATGATALAVSRNTPSEKRGRRAVFATILLIPAVVNVLLRGLDYGYLNCSGDGYYINESSCTVLNAQMILFALPTLAAITFVLAKGWRLLLFKRSY